MINHTCFYCGKPVTVTDATHFPPWCSQCVPYPPSVRHPNQLAKTLGIPKRLIDEGRSNYSSAKDDAEQWQRWGPGLHRPNPEL